MPSLVNVSVRQVFNNSACLQQAFLLDAIFSEINQKIRCGKLKEDSKTPSATDNSSLLSNSEYYARETRTICLISSISQRPRCYSGNTNTPCSDIALERVRLDRNLHETACPFRLSLPTPSAVAPEPQNIRLLEFYVPSQSDSPAAHVITVVGETPVRLRLETPPDRLNVCQSCLVPGLTQNYPACHEDISDEGIPRLIYTRASTKSKRHTGQRPTQRLWSGRCDIPLHALLQLQPLDLRQTEIHPAIHDRYIIISKRLPEMISHEHS